MNRKDVKKKDISNNEKVLFKESTKESQTRGWFKYFAHLCVSIFGSVLGVISWIVTTMVGLISLVLIFGFIVSGIIYLKIKPDLDSCMEIAYDKLVNMSEDDFIGSMDTYVYDKDGNAVGIINSGNFEYVDINHISMNIQNGYISQEDKRFKEHMGVDFISTSRALLALIKNKGEITQGGSTITQQVIKNTYLTQERSFKRKIIEILLAPRLEMKFSKAKIMEYYCNKNYYGNRCYGVQAGSQYYFGKNASDVSIAEAAMLVGLSNSPSMYDPIKHYDDALKKRNKIIENLYANGYISKENKEDALSENLEIVQKEGKGGFETYQSTYAIHCAAITLMKHENFNFKYLFNDKSDYDVYVKNYDKVYNEKLDEIRGGGFSIYTSLDSSIQEKFQTSIDSNLSEFVELQENGKYAMQGAAAVADNKTGYIVAIVGGRGTSDQYNRAYLSARQPGSVIKPLIDYAPAFDTGEYYPSKVMNDHKLEDGPKNSSGSYRGNITIREAVNRSINTIAWQVLKEIGVNNGFSYLGKMRFHKLSYIDNNVISLSIGGFTNGVRIVDMTKGYQTLANSGVYNDKTCIIDIKDHKGVSVIKDYKAETKQVYTEDSAYMMTDILKDTIHNSYGTAYGLGLNNAIPAAGKTGTTNSNKDTWFCGYTKQYTASVWVGYDTPREMPGIYGATYAGRIWQQAMNAIHDGIDSEDWINPETVYKSNYIMDSGEATDLKTGLTDIFSRLNEVKAKELEKERQNEIFFKEVENQVISYERKNIDGPEDTYTIENDFNQINNEISKIEDTKKRTEFYNRIYEKYKNLLKDKNEMKHEIAIYEKSKVEKESAKAEEAKLKAEKKRLDFMQKTRESAAFNAISKIEELKYIPDTDDLIHDAKNALASIKKYDSYLSYYKRLEAAIESLKRLPRYEEYKKQEAIKESEEAVKKASEDAYKESLQNQLDSIITKESENWQKGPTDSNNQLGPLSVPIVQQTQAN